MAIARAAGLADENVHDAVMLLDRLLRLGLGREAANPAVLAGVAVLSTKQGALPPGSTHFQADDESQLGLGREALSNPGLLPGAALLSTTHCTFSP